MNISNPPVDINISIESLTIERDAFYNVCFITESDTAPRTLEVAKLKDLLDNGYDRLSLAYNFCVGVLAQQAMSKIYIRAKRTNENYEAAFDADNNTSYYFVTIESKDIDVINVFSDYVSVVDDYKLLFFSSPFFDGYSSKSVQYYQELPVNHFEYPYYYLIKSFYPTTDTLYDVTLSTELGIDITDENGNELLIYFNSPPAPEPPSDFYQTSKLAYPESAWVSVCGNLFPSSVQWLYKYLAKVDVYKIDDIPERTTTTSSVLKNPATVGSGLTRQGIPIHEQVSLDWLKWALSRRVWNVLYTKDKVNADNGGSELITNEIKLVLDLAVEQGMFTEYNITSVSLNRKDNNISVKFTANTTFTIYNLEVSGSLSY